MMNKVLFFCISVEMFAAGYLNRNFLKEAMKSLLAPLNRFWITLGHGTHQHGQVGGGGDLQFQVNTYL